LIVSQITLGELNAAQQQEIILKCLLSHFLKRCEGGDILEAMSFIMAKGISNADEYNYNAARGTCNMNVHKPIYYQSNAAYTYMGGNEEFLKIIFVRYGPAVVVIS
jgi:Papain family cysteine protease